MGKQKAKTQVTNVKVTPIPSPTPNEAFRKQIKGFGDVTRIAAVQVGSQQYPCSCGVGYSTPSAHKAACTCKTFDDWVEGLCEWDALSKSYVYYANGPDGQVYLTDYQELLMPDGEFWDIANRYAPPGAQQHHSQKPKTVKKPECTCTPEKGWMCDVCGVFRETQKDPWQRKKGGGKQGTLGSDNWDDYGGYAWFATKDRHAMAEVVFPNGVKIYGSSHHSRDKDEKRPTFGIYLDNMWSPDCLAYMIPWQDYGIPKIPLAQAFAAISDGYDFAVEGGIVEVGCIGGHGRTGTAIACMAVLAGVKPKNAAKWVQNNYCSHAVESKKQEWLIECFGAWLTNTPYPPQPPDPPPYVPKKGTITYSTPGTSGLMGKPASAVTPPPTIPGTPFPDYKHNCVLCFQEMVAVEHRHPGSPFPVTAYNCFNLACTVGKVNAHKKQERMAEEILAETVEDIAAAVYEVDEVDDPETEIEELLTEGNWVQAAITTLYADPDREYPWPGFTRIQNEFEWATEPITLEQAVRRAVTEWELEDSF